MGADDDVGLYTQSVHCVCMYVKELVYVNWALIMSWDCVLSMCMCMCVCIMLHMLIENSCGSIHAGIVIFFALYACMHKHILHCMYVLHT